MPTYQGGRVKWAWKHKALATLDQIPPVANTYYTLLDTTEDVRILTLVIQQINDEAAAKSCNVRLTADGVTLTSAATSIVNTTEHYVNLNPTSAVPLIGTTILLLGYYTAACFQSLKVEVRQTTAVGTNQKLYGRLRYETLEAS